MLTLKNFLRRELEKQRVVLFYWLPVALACGIGCYLSLRQEPAPNLFIAMALLGGISYLGYHFQICSLAPFFLLLAVFCLGFFAVAGKAHYVAAPTLTYRFYGEIEGRIIGVDRAQWCSKSDAGSSGIGKHIQKQHSPESAPFNQWRPCSAAFNAAGAFKNQRFFDATSGSVRAWRV